MAIAAAIAAFLASTASTRWVLHFLKRKQILDLPNERSSHALPTPRGLGLGVVPIVVVAWLLIGAFWPSARQEIFVVCIAASVLAALSWVDDLRNLPAAPRLLAQVVAVSIGVAAFGAPALFPATWMPTLVGQAVCALLWLGLINQVNFTDGIDGNLGAMLVCVGIGLFGVTVVSGGPMALGALALTLAGAAAAFLQLNWSPAKAFMGDVGSVPIGYLTGWLLMRTAADIDWAPVLILPLFYFADTAVTYSSMILRGHKFWRPHRNYLYQRASPGMSHARIVVAIVVCNVALIALALALAAAGGSDWLVFVALVPVAAAYVYLARSATPA
jgi:UDP-N-acetylmuramyl pentapeptide phosphotransferase/UDP-N-acetylglucosamine-1-phosphate transferase